MGVLVIGAHRSGTSAVAGALEATGLFVGPPTGLIPALPENPEGFFELQAVVDLNEEILDLLGGTWHSPPDLPMGWIDDPTLAEFVTRARTLVASSFQGRQFVLKDPRIALLLPLWRRALLDRCSAVMILRDPVAVAWSLALRNGLSTFASFALWSTYYRSAIDGLSGLPVHVCRYEELVDNPADVLTPIMDSLRDWGELPQDADTEAVLARIKPELQRDTWPRHHQDLMDPPAEILALEEFLTKETGRHDSFDISPVPQAGGWESALLRERRIARLHLSDASALRDQNDELQLELDTSHEERNQLETSLEQLLSESDARRRDDSEVDQALERALRALDDLQRDCRKLESNLRDRDQALSDIQNSEVFRATFPLRWAINRTQTVRGKVERQHAVSRFPTRLQASAALTRFRLRKSEAVTDEAVQRDGDIIRRSGIFDARFYVEEYPDVKGSNVDPLEHYLRFGATKGRSPHPLFDPHYYASQLTRDEKVNNPLAHYLRNQGPENIDPHPLFDGHYYKQTYLKEHGLDLDPFLHYLNVGGPAGYAPNRAFDVTGYTFDHPDVHDFRNALEHYVRLGRHSGFSPHPLFEAEWYGLTYPTATKAGMDAYEHFVRKGLAEGLLGSRALGENPDIVGPFPVPTGGQSPEVTVIIPTYKNYLDTYRCLTSLSRTSDHYASFKVIVVDDCPDHAVGSLLLDHPGIEIRTNSENYGFLRTCNRAAAICTTDYIVFLNNDTVVTPDWLSSLVELANRLPTAGMIGSKLLNFDDTIQEAGGMILRNGWGSPFCAGRERNIHEANYVREVDCVIGACMLVRRAAFEGVDGFDDRYAPAFYEEFDLAFKLRDAGFRVMYQPKSEVYHLGSSSYGAEARDALTERNHQQFVTKWSSELADQPESASLNFKGRMRGCAAGTILVIEDQVPEPDKHAGAVTITQYLHLLAEEGFRVILWPHDRKLRSPYADDLQQAGIEVAYGRESFTDWLSSASPWLDFALLARPDTATHYLDHLRRKSKARLLYYTHDLHFLREQRRYDIEGDERALRESLRLKVIESRIFNTVDCVCTPSADEVPVIRQLAPSVEVIVLPPYFYETDVSEITGRQNLAQNMEVLFVGGYKHSPNVDAATVLVEQVMPLVWQEIPDARVMVVGSNPTPEVLQLAGPRVEIVGFAPDLEPLYARARMTVNPLRYGAGVKGKIVDSLRNGVPVVTTSIGAEGIGLTTGKDALIGETTRELADHVIMLFQEPQRLSALVEAGATIIRDSFGRDRARNTLMAALETKVTLPTRRPSRRPSSVSRPSRRVGR